MANFRRVWLLYGLKHVFFILLQLKLNSQWWSHGKHEDSLERTLNLSAVILENHSWTNVYSRDAVSFNYKPRIDSLFFTSLNL